MTTRIISFLAVLLSALFLPLWFVVLLSVVYGFVYAPYELLIIGLLIDAQFGGGEYVYTISIIVINVFLLLIKPQLRMYNRT